LLNRDEWQAGEIAAGRLWILERIIKEERSGAGPHPRDLVMRVWRLRQGRIVSHAAERALRLRGELYESDGLPEEAMRDFEEALQIDPAVGLRRKVAQMRKARRQC
jgi:tetratricopeptide (TPR) repeat protein